MTYEEAPMLDALVPIMSALRERIGVGFNRCLFNYFETGDSRMGFHADEMRGLLPVTGWRSCRWAACGSYHIDAKRTPGV